MNYYALFLGKSNYAEKCISLMRFISNPSSCSWPHITVRLFKMPVSRIEELRKHKFTYLDIIEPGTFNLEQKKPPYVVFLQCESVELEGIEYKPDFPYSRLHITLYEGSDYSYAQRLYQLLCSSEWRFRLIFDKPRLLQERKIGTKTYGKPDFETIYKEIIGESYQEFLDDRENVLQKLKLIENVFHKLTQYVKDMQVEKIESIYENQRSFINKFAEKESFGQYRFKFDATSEGERYVIEKPVRDAIYITPPEYARDMAKCGLTAFGEDDRKIDFGDSSIGTGTLYLALRLWVEEVNKRNNKNYEFNSAVGVDIDRNMVMEAYTRCHKRGLNVILGDALSPDINLGDKRNLLLVNPPFNRHEEIPSEYKAAIYQFAKEQSGISVPGNAGLFVYHLLIMDKWLCNDAVAVWLLPTVFMQSKYGETVRRYLLNSVQLIRIHAYNEEVMQFENTLISTSIVVFKKTKEKNDEKVLFSSGDSVDHPMNSRYLTREELNKYLDNWRVLFNNAVLSDMMIGQIKFGDLFEIKRGVATGANSFFVMTREEAKQRHIPDIALRPLIPKARYLKSLVIEAKEDGYPDVEPQLVMIDCDLDENTIQNNYPDFYDYLQLAKIKENNNLAIVDRHLVSGRKPWYKQERREPPVFLLTYMGRNKMNLPPLYFIWNKSEGIALNTYLLLYPKRWLLSKLDDNPMLYEVIFKALNQSADIIISDRTRIYSGGLKKIEPNELCKLPIIGLEKELSI